MKDSVVSKNIKTLKVDHLFKKYGKAQAVEDVSFVLNEGSIMALVGPSGCGKTTTLRLIAGFEIPENGTIELQGKVVASKLEFVTPDKRHVGMVFQDYALFPHLTVFENIAFGLKSKNSNGKVSKSDFINTVVQQAISLVGLDGFSDRMPHQLSGGEQQRVAIARALAPKPSVLLLDEPFSNLDANLRNRLRKDVKSILKEVGCSTIFVTHDQEEAFLIADQIGMMLEGKVVQVGTPHEVYSNPSNSKIAKLLGEANLIEGFCSNGRVDTFIGQHVTDSELQGPVHVLVRPEALMLKHASAGRQAAVIVDKEYYGHYEVLTVKFDNETSLLVRSGPNGHFAIGDNVSVTMSGAVKIFN